MHVLVYNRKICIPDGRMEQLTSPCQKVFLSPFVFVLFNKNSPWRLEAGHPRCVAFHVWYNWAMTFVVRVKVWLIILFFHIHPKHFHLPWVGEPKGPRPGLGWWTAARGLLFSEILFIGDFHLELSFGLKTGLTFFSILWQRFSFVIWFIKTWHWQDSSRFLPWQGPAMLPQHLQHLDKWIILKHVSY